MLRNITLCLFLLTVTTRLLAQSPPALSGLDAQAIVYDEGSEPIAVANTVQVGSDALIVRATVQIS